MRVVKPQGVASQEGYRGRWKSPQRDQYHTGKTRHGKSPMTRSKPLGPCSPAGKMHQSVYGHGRASPYSNIKTNSSRNQILLNQSSRAVRVPPRAARWVPHELPHSLNASSRALRAPPRAARCVTRNSYRLRMGDLRHRFTKVSDEIRAHHHASGSKNSPEFSG